MYVDIIGYHCEAHQRHLCTQAQPHFSTQLQTIAVMISKVYRSHFLPVELHHEFNPFEVKCL